MDSTKNKTVAVTAANGGRIRCRLSGIRTLADGRVVALAKQNNRPIAMVQYVHPPEWPNWRIITDKELAN